MLVVEKSGKVEAVFREREVSKARQFAQLLANQLGGYVSVLRVRGSRRTLLHQVQKQQPLWRSQ
jgi:hypothetical protein